MLSDAIPYVDVSASDASKNGIEEIEGSYRADADEVEQRALHAQIGKRLMQALEDSICPMFLWCFVWHKGVQ
jgi:hypothetical protein